MQSIASTVAASRPPRSRKPAEVTVSGQAALAAATATGDETSSAATKTISLPNRIRNTHPSLARRKDRTGSPRSGGVAGSRLARYGAGDVDLPIHRHRGVDPPLGTVSSEHGSALELHDAILRRAIAANGGEVFKHTGDGMAASFVSPSQATRAALTAQRSLATAGWPAEVTLRVRMGLHTGEATTRDGDYFGVSVNKAARLMGVGHGGQVLLSETTSSMLDRTDEWNLKELGQH